MVVRILLECNLVFMEFSVNILQNNRFFGPLRNRGSLLKLTPIHASVIDQIQSSKFVSIQAKLSALI